jgi:hypothetical protein
MAGDANKSGDSNIKKNNPSNAKSKYKWLRRLYTEKYSPTETIIPKEEIHQTRVKWENIVNKYYKDPNSRRQCLSQVAKEIARNCKHTGDQWIVTLDQHVLNLQKEGIDETSARKTLREWKRIGELQRSKPHLLTNQQKEDLIIHLTRQEVLEKGLPQFFEKKQIN